MSRLPIVGGDNDVWGQILNDFLSVSLNADGTLRPVTSVNGLAVGGATGQMLVKKSANDFDTKWKTPLDWINVKDFGALGNGSNDDTTAINNAIAAAVGGAVVYFPVGTYLISSPIQIATWSGTTLMGAGSQSSIIQIKSSGWSGSRMLDIQLGYVTVRDLGFDGQSIGSGVDGIRIYATYLVTIMDCIGLNCTGWFINAVDNGVSAPSEIKLLNLYYGGAAGIHLTSGSTINFLPSTATLTNISINIFGAGDGLFLDGVSDVSCANVQIKMHSAASAFSSIHIKGKCTNIQIVNADCGSAAFGNYTGVTYLIEEDGSANRPNKVNFANGTATGQGTGMSVDCDNFIMSGHTFSQSQHDGIDIVGAGSNILLSSVQVQQSGLAASNTYYDISVTNTTGVVTLNSCFGESTSTSVAANLLTTANTVDITCTWSATTPRAGTPGPYIEAPGNMYFNTVSGHGHFFKNGSSDFGVVGAVGELKIASQIYPGEGFSLQNSGGFMHATGVPGNGMGNDNDWCISDNGHFYFKTGGAWVQKI